MNVSFEECRNWQLGLSEFKLRAKDLESRPKLQSPTSTPCLRYQRTPESRLVQYLSIPRKHEGPRRKHSLLPTTAKQVQLRIQKPRDRCINMVLRLLVPHNCWRSIIFLLCIQLHSPNPNAYCYWPQTRVSSLVAYRCIKDSISRRTVALMPVLSKPRSLCQPKRRNLYYWP